MSSKFHVGQKVRVVRAKPTVDWSYLNGKTGVVTTVHDMNNVHSVELTFDDDTRHKDGDREFGFTDDELEAVEEQAKLGLVLYSPGDGKLYGPYRVVSVDGEESWVKPVPVTGGKFDTPWEMGFVVRTSELKTIEYVKPVDSPK